MFMIRSIDADVPPKLRLWALPILTAVLLILDASAGLGTPQITMIAAMAIVLAGIPHGTLDVEIAAVRFGLSGRPKKLAIIAAYISCALAMILLWRHAPELALCGFLIISIVHFSADWRGGVDPFLAMMVGWALIALPALSHPYAVAAIFEMLTGNENGQTIAAILACASVPAALGSMVFAYWTFQQGDLKTAVDVMCCLIAALFLPPLIAFAVFFCGLHSPRHMKDALRETGGLSPTKKAAIIAVVTGLSVGMGALLFADYDASALDVAVIKTGFVLLSTLTVPHFILEHLMAGKIKVIRSALHCTN
jgi:Brp/Blh family beta-carotene 15,15'-monooxygenase